MLTLFTAIKLPDHIANLIAPFQKGNDGIRWSPEENLHITVGYFGQVGDEYAEILDHELAQAPGPAFDIRLKGANVFGGSKPHTLWLGVEDWGGLHGLHAHVRKAARRAHIEMESRNFTPHLSLAYMRGGVDLGDLSRFLERHQTFQSRPFLVDQFGLYSSHRVKTGPNRYEQEANYPLMG